MRTKQNIRTTGEWLATQSKKNIGGVRLIETVDANAIGKLTAFDPIGYGHLHAALTAFV